MGGTLDKALVLTILQHAEDFPWRMQEIGLLGLRLDEQRTYRLHVWDPSEAAGEPPIHDHPYHFTSRVIAGEITNTRYEEDPAGDEYARFRYSPGAEDARRLDAVRLSGTATTFTEAEEYRQIGVSILMESDNGHTHSFIVTRIDDETLTVDGNNPLCGREVVFRLEVLAVRDATDEEMKAGGAIEAAPDVDPSRMRPV